MTNPLAPFDAIRPLRRHVPVLGSGVTGPPGEWRCEKCGQPLMATVHVPHKHSVAVVAGVMWLILLVIVIVSLF